MIWTKTSKVTTAPASEPITAATLKNWLKIEPSVSDDDTLVSNLIISARTEIENQTGLAFFTQTVTDTLDEWPVIENVNNPYGGFYLMRYPVQSVTSITYYDSDGNQQTLATTKYDVDTTGTFCRIAPAAGQTLPTLRNRIAAVTITYVAGYSDTADIPETLKTAVQLMASAYYERRSDSVKERRTAAMNLVSSHYVHVV